MCRNCILLNKNCRKNCCFKFYCTAKNHSSLHTLIKVLVTFSFSFFLLLSYELDSLLDGIKDIYQYLLSLSRSMSLFNFTILFSRYSVFLSFFFFLLQFNIS